MDYFLIVQGGDDVGQLYFAKDEEFLEIMALVGMTKKPMHVRRLQTTLAEWFNNQTLFDVPLTTEGNCMHYQLISSIKFIITFLIFSHRTESDFTITKSIWWNPIF